MVLLAFGLLCVLDIAAALRGIQSSRRHDDMTVKQFSECRMCGSRSVTTIDSYKHHWIQCNGCGNIHRARKSQYPMERILPMYFLELLVRKRFSRLKRYLNDLYRVQEVVERESAFYDYYAQVSRIPVEETAWAFLPIRFDSLFKRYDMDVSGKTILDISGGPGYLTKHLGPKCKKAVVTEFSQRAVDGMRKHLGINAVKYDYNSYSLDEVTQDTFDLVIIEYSINFCKDLRAFVSQLYRIVADRGVVYVSFVPPTLGCCLRWQHDEYTYNSLWQPSTLVKAFVEAGFTLVDQYSDGEYHYLRDIRSYPWVRLPFVFYYRTKALWTPRIANKQLIQRNVVCMFAKVSEKKSSWSSIWKATECNRGQDDYGEKN